MDLSFSTEVNKFVDQVNSLRTTLPEVMKVVESTIEESAKAFAEFLSNKQIEKKKVSDTKIEFSVPINLHQEFRKLEYKLKNSSNAVSFIPKSFLVTLVSKFDAYLGILLRVIFNKRPEILSSSERQMTFAQLVDFDSIEEASEFIIEKEIESFLRSSHPEQIIWLEKTLKMPLRKDLEVWPTYVELTERRNLFVHSDGVISNQYCKICKDNGWDLDSIGNIGERLDVDPDYFNQACDCIFEMGVKLAHVLWRKLEPENLKKADNNFNSICYDLIDRQNYNLAIVLLDFATDILKKHSSAEMYLYLLINKAQAMKWSGNYDGCKKLLDSKDWSATGYKFKLVRYSLIDDYDKAAEYMKLVGKDGEITKFDYMHWPIFKEFRKTKQFLAVYEDIFGVKFVEEEELETSDDNLPSEVSDLIKTN